MPGGQADIQRIGKPVMIGGTDPPAYPHGQSMLIPISPNDFYSAGRSPTTGDNPRPARIEVGNRALDRRLRY